MTKKKKIWIACGAVTVLALIIFFSISATRKDEVLVQTAKVVTKDLLQAKVSASGSIRAKEFVELQSEISGVVTELPVREGDSVNKGDVLLKIDPIQTAAQTNSQQAQFDAAQIDVRSQQFQIANAEQNLAATEASLRSSEAELAQSDNNLARTRSSFLRSQQLSEEGLISREEYEQAQNSLKAAQANFEVAKARLAQIKTQLEISKNNVEQMKKTFEASQTRLKSQAAILTQATDQLRKTTIYAPLSGVITQLNIEKGERAVPGVLNSPQATLMVIADLSIIQAELKVDETDIVSLAIGNPAKVKVDALPDVEFDGTVSEIGNSPITTGAATQEAKDFKVVVTLKDPDAKIRPGMSCTGDIITDTREHVLAIPIQALTIREVEVDKEGNYIQPDLNQPVKTEAVARADSSQTKINKKELEGVFVVNNDNRVRFRPVKTGITGESEIEVRSDLKEGEVIVSGSFQTLRTIRDGAFVKIDSSTAQEPTKSPS